MKQDNIEIKQSIIDSTAQLTEKIANTNLRIDTFAENVCGIINIQTELICEKIICEDFIVVENTCVITNDNYKVINIKEEKQIEVNKTYLINSDIPSVRHTHNSKSHKMTPVSYTHLDVYKRQE